MLVGFEVLLLLVVPQQSFPLFISHTFGCEVVVRLVRPRLVWSCFVCSSLFSPRMLDAYHIGFIGGGVMATSGNGAGS